ncbi:Ig-like domain-containing protein [Cellulophaga baltica]|uniref:HYDIN/VesB/CFA65-like Ig-like domain-containing protein n=1 Tax=Cellulophaga baltica 18 TaxID=1348584 RepID=A0AAU8RB94_9FLAO|nr:DUF1573 domain-containing protein [Cellulophaga baltica]AIZ40702.1 hypothetical protein M666_03390 [Cellulophaga baltica 18]
MKFNIQILTLICFASFFSCSSDDEAPPKIIVVEEEVIEDTAIINLTSEESNEIDFGDVVTNITSTRVFTIHNSGNSDLKIANIIIPDNYTIDLLTSIIPSNQSKEFTVTFTPTDILDYTDLIKIESNATSGTASIIIKGIGVNSIYDGSVTLITQDEVEDFAKSGYTEITGALFIGNINNFSPINSLASLNKITEVGSLQVISTTELEDLTGLENLNVTVSIQLLSNSALKNVDALLSVTKLSSYLSLLSNTALTQINGLSNISEIGDNLRVNNHPNLINLDGLANIITVKNKLYIENNSLIENLNGLSSLQSVSSVSIRYNAELYSYCGIKSLLTNKGIGEDYFRPRFNRYNPSSYTIEDFDCEKMIPDGIIHSDTGYGISEQKDIDYLISNDFHGIDGGLIISSENITSLESLSFLKTVSGSIRINDTALTNLNGLENLTNVAQIYILNNLTLSDYCGLSPLIVNGSLGENLYPSSEPFYTVDNLYNPTLADIQNGLCSE